MTSKCSLWTVTFVLVSAQDLVKVHIVKEKVHVWEKQQYQKKNNNKQNKENIFTVVSVLFKNSLNYRDSVN